MNKLLYIAGSRIPSDTANSVHVVHMCSALAEIGWDVEVVAYGGPASGSEISRLYGADSAELCRWRLLGGGKLRRFLGLARILLENDRKQPVYGRNAWGLWLAVLLGYSSVYYEAHVPPRGLARRWIERRLLGSRSFRGLVVITDQLRQWYKRWLVSPRIPILVAPDSARSWSSCEVPQDASEYAYEVVYAGSLHPGKCMEVLTDVAACVPDVTFRVVGGRTEDVAKWRAEAPRNIKFQGRVDPGSVARYLERANCLIAPYSRSVASEARTDDIAKWMSPLKIFEYMSHGKPIVATDLPALREVLEDGRNAVLVSEKDIQGWGNAIVRLRDDRKLARRLGRQAWIAWRTYYTWHARAQRVSAFMASHPADLR